MNFIITIDTEADNQWQFGSDITLNNIKYIPRFQSLCNKYLIKPTYLVTSEVCEDDFSQDFFSKLISDEKSEVGAHLHIWTTLPFEEKAGFRYNDEYHGYASELPIQLLREKIRTLTNQIETAFGRPPISFRSGRYGFNENIARVLVENHYLVDTSVTPFINWSLQQGIPYGNGGPDFHNKTSHPYYYHFSSGSLLEVPITILPTKYPLNRNFKFTDYYFNNVDNTLLLRFLRRFLFNHQPLWLRPFDWMNDKMLANIIDEALRIELPFLVMIIHSSEFMPGCSAYRKDKASVERLFNLLECFFIMLQKKNIRTETLTEAANKFIKRT
jgi:hypothetical protein